MMISSMGSNNYNMGQMSAMGSRSPTQGEATGSRPDPAAIFNKVDEDSSGGLDQTEFQTLAGKISEATGEEVDVEELFATYDADEDGVLNEEETQTAMEANRPAGPPPGGPPPGGGMGGMSGGAPPDLAQIFSDADEDESGALDESEVQDLAEMISQATEEEVDAADLIAAFDEDEDGVLNEEETTAALEANRPEGPPPQAGMQSEAAGSSSLPPGFERYLEAAALGTEQNQTSNWFSSMGGDTTSGNASAVFNSVNTWS